MVRPYNASVPMAWVFIEILRRLPPMPKTKRQATNCQGAAANPNDGKVTAYSRAASRATGRLPKRATSQPASGREVSNPAGSDRSTAPRAALSRCNFRRISGIRDAQLEKHSPARKKKQLTAIRCSRRGGKERRLFITTVGLLLQAGFSS